MFVIERESNLLFVVRKKFPSVYLVNLMQCTISMREQGEKVDVEKEKTLNCSSLSNLNTKTGKETLASEIWPKTFEKIKIK